MAENIQEMPELIDTDVHNAVPREELIPYLPRVWHQQWLETGMDFTNYYSDVGRIRKDARPPGGGMPGSDPHYLLEHHVERYKVDYAILTGPTNYLAVSVHPDVDYANAVARAYNDWLVETWLPVSPKYKGSILINPSDPHTAAEEIERMASHPDMVQIIMSSASRQLYGNRFYHPIYEAAERHGLPVAIHPGIEGTSMSGTPTPSGYPSRYVEYQTILPINYMAQVNSLIFEGVFERFPDLMFIAIEGGVCWLPHLMWRMDKNFKALRDTVPWLKRRPSEYVKTNLRLTTQPIEEPDNPKHLTQIFEMIDADEIVMFSSDYPHWDFDNPDLVLNTLPREMRRAIRGTTAARLYGLTKKVDSDVPQVVSKGGQS